MKEKIAPTSECLNGVKSSECWIKNVRISRIYRIGRIIHPEHLANLVNLGSDKRVCKQWKMQNE
jgi:hypothetical protein